MQTQHTCQAVERLSAWSRGHAVTAALPKDNQRFVDSLGANWPVPQRSVLLWDQYRIDNVNDAIVGLKVGLLNGCRPNLDTRCRVYDE